MFSPGRLVFEVTMVLFLILLQTGVQKDLTVRDLHTPHVGFQGGRASFVCDTVQHQIFFVSWFLNGTGLETYHLSYVTHENNRLTFTYLPLEYNGTLVKCSARNFDGVEAESNTAVLLIQGQLPSVGSLNATRDNTTLFISWRAPFTLDVTYTDPDIKDYCVDIYEINSTSSKHLYSRCGINVTHHHIMLNLSGCFNIEVEVIAVNIIGNGSTAGFNIPDQDDCQTTTGQIIESVTTQNVKSQTIPKDVNTIILTTVLCGLLITVVLVAAATVFCLVWHKKRKIYSIAKKVQTSRTADNAESGSGTDQSGSTARQPTEPTEPTESTETTETTNKTVPIVTGITPFSKQEHRIQPRSSCTRDSDHTAKDPTPNEPVAPFASHYGRDSDSDETPAELPAVPSMSDELQPPAPYNPSYDGLETLCDGDSDFTVEQTSELPLPVQPDGDSEDYQSNVTATSENVEGHYTLVTPKTATCSDSGPSHYSAMLLPNTDAYKAMGDYDAVVYNTVKQKPLEGPPSKTEDLDKESPCKKDLASSV